MQCGRGQQSVDNRNGRLSRRYACLNPSPTIGHRLIYRQDSISKAKHQIVVEPGFECDAPGGLGEGTNSFPNLTKRKNAEAKQTFFRRVYPSGYAGFRLCFY